MKRREVLVGGAALAGMAMLPKVSEAQDTYAPKPGAWRRFEIVTRMEIVRFGGAAQAWIPLPSVAATDWSRPEGNDWTGNATQASIWRDPKYGGELVHARWAPGDAPPVVEVTTRYAARDRATDFRAAKPARLSSGERRLNTQATELIPTDGIVQATARQITGRHGTDAAKARAIYEWVVDNTFRDGKVLGCGLGDVASMLQTGNLGGKCADLNALYVGLARAAGIPARDVYGIRVAPSRFGYKALGAGGANVTRAQHCRAEVWLDGQGWVPVDPADVRKVVLEEPPGNLAVDDAKVVAARNALFGAWEGNWMPYNTAHDVKLPGSSAPALPFLMYPQVETAAGLADCLEPDAVRYTITAKEVTA